MREVLSGSWSSLSTLLDSVSYFTFGPDTSVHPPPEWNKGCCNSSLTSQVQVQQKLEPFPAAPILIGPQVTCAFLTPCGPCMPDVDWPGLRHVLQAQLTWGELGKVNSHTNTRAS